MNVVRAPVRKAMERAQYEAYKKKLYEIQLPTSGYGKRIERLSQRIFGELAVPTDHKSYKIIKVMSAQPLEDMERYNTTFYPPHPMFFYMTKMLRMHGLFRDEHLDFAEQMERNRVLRGKGRPPPGQGKRSKNKT